MQPDTTQHPKNTAPPRRRDKSQRVRLGNRTIVTYGRPRYFWSDFFHECLTLRWPAFFGLVALMFLALNAAFALLYGLGEQPIANQAPAGFWGAFFFSVETLATVGYGDMHPQSLYGHMLATAEIFVGMMSIAVVTGLVFARFSRPRAKIMFTHHPVIGPVEGKPTLTIRAANARQNVISEATARLRMVRRELSAEGMTMRRLHDLELIRDHHPIFSLGWNLMHVIDERSPLYGMTAESLEEMDADLILIIEGTDETTVQPMRARMNYNHAQIRWSHRYADIATDNGDGITHMDYTKFQDVIPL